MTVGREIENPPPLPKQMVHWFGKYGVRFNRRARGRRREWLYGYSRRKALLVGEEKVRCFRVLPHLDRMDICDGAMDRWANSMGASISPIPRTEAEFHIAVATLLKKAAKRIERH